MVSEDRLLHWLRSRLDDSWLGESIGDDAAVLPRGGPFAVTMDSQIAGIHFTPGLDPALVARRLLAVNLSDLAAMGARPTYAFLALATPPGFDHRRFFRALLAECRRVSLRLAGGDLAASPQTVATLTLIGTKPPRCRWVRRSGAAPGHALWLGGTVGESAAGRLLIERGARPRSGRSIDLPAGLLAAAPAVLRTAARRAVRRHVLPVPQLALGSWLGRQQEGAAIDVSDGVAIDLHRLCRESGAGQEIGAAIGAEDIPFSARFHDLCAAIGADPLALALGGGEDYVLLFTLPPGIVPPSGFGCRKIGSMTRTPTITLHQGGAVRLLPPKGWDHLKKQETPAF